MNLRPLWLSLTVLVVAVGAVTDDVMSAPSAPLTVSAVTPPTGTPLTTQRPATPVPDGWWAVVTANDVYLRSAPSVESSYPYAAFAQGTVVRVVEESLGWGRVAAIGPAFRELFGYIKADRRVRLSDDGRSAEITGRTDVLAPNLAARYSPDTSWKAIARLEPGAKVSVGATVEGQREVVYRIPLPADAEGWINLSFLRRATADEIAAVDPTAKPRTPDAGGAVTPTPNQTPGRQPGAPGDQPRTDRSTTDTTPDRPGAATTDPSRVAPPATRTEDADGVTDPAAQETVAANADAAVAEPEVRIVAEPPAPPRVRLSDLERAFERLMLEDPATAEVTGLRASYLAFADEAEIAAERDFARGRAEQLAMRETVQDRLQRARRLRARSDVDLEVIRSTRDAMDARQGYVAVGKLNASSVFDGVRLPLLYRLEDPTGGQTIAYLQPGRDERDFDLSTLLGQLVGIVGTRAYDEGLRVNIVVPTRIDLLAGVR